MEIGITNIVTYILLAASWVVFYILMIKIDDKLNMPEPSEDNRQFVYPEVNSVRHFVYDPSQPAGSFPEQPVKFVNEPEEDYLE